MTKINLVDLDYENIRTSLLEYLKKQDTVKDLNFEGSAVNFLLDLLAYNTLFYAHYANMVSGEAFLDSAQLERSIVSLVKPLGYVLPTRTSAIGRIQLISVTDAATIKPFSVSVIGSNSDGLQSQFWNIDSVSVVEDNKTEFFSVYEGTYNVATYGGDGFDFPEQKILIPDLTLDVRTIRVSVQRAGEDEFKYWTLVDTFSGGFVEPTSNLYSLERTSGGFIVKFRTTSSTEANLKSGDVVKLEYLSSNGSNGNLVSNFTSVITPNDSGIVNIQPSFGGLDTPNLEEAKRIAPLVFSAQQRLVTKSDYRGFLAQLGYTEGVNVWGGEENSPAMHGRLLFTIREITTSQNTIITDIITKLKERSVVTILPEYVSPKAMTVSVSLKLNYDPNKITTQTNNIGIAIQNDLKKQYPIGSFEKNLNEFTIRNTVEQYSGYFVESIDSLVLSYSIVPSDKQISINFKNPLRKGTNQNNTGVSVISSLFTSSLYSGGNVQIRDVPIIFGSGSLNAPSIGKLKLFGVNFDGVYTEIAEVGSVDYSTGILTIVPGLSLQPYNIQVNPSLTTDIISKDEVYLNVTTTITSITEI